MKTEPKQQRPTSAETVAVVIEFVREFLRSKPLIPFHRDELHLQIPVGFAERLGEPEADKDRLRSILSVALANLEERFPGLQVSARENLWCIDLSLKGSAEWADVLRFAHGAVDPDAAPELSPAGAKLLERVESGELSNQFRSEISVRHRIRFYGHFSPFSDLIAEIRVKRGIELKLEEQGPTNDMRRRFLKFTIAARPGLTAPPVAFNPVLPNDGGKLPSRREFQRWFWQMLIDSPFSGSESKLFWSFSSRKEFFRCLPHYADDAAIETDKLVELLHSVRGHHAVRFGWDFGFHSTVGTSKSGRPLLGRKPAGHCGRSSPALAPRPSMGSAPKPLRSLSGFHPSRRADWSLA